MVWRIISYATGLTPPNSIRHMFGSWLSNQSKKIRNLIWVGVAAVCWAIWRCRNDIIFHKVKYHLILQVIFRGAYWLRFWTQLQREEQAKTTLSLMSRKHRDYRFGVHQGRMEHFLSFAVILSLRTASLSSIFPFMRIL